MINMVVAATERRGAVQHWALAFAGFFLLIAAWSVATPYDGTPDEMQHVIRAAGVVAGQVAPTPTAAQRGSGAFQTVPGGLVRSWCWQGMRHVSAACAQPLGGDVTPTRAGTGAGRYHPVYYAVVGWPLALRPGWSGVLLARLINAGLCAALLAGAYVVIMRRTRRRLMMAALLAVTTPMTVHMAGAVNPSGLEIAAGVAFFTAAIPLMLRERTGSWRGLIFLTGISGLILTMIRETGPLWIMVAFIAFAFPLWRGNLPALLRQRAAVWWVAAITVSTAVSAVWIIVMKTSDLGDFRPTTPLSLLQSTLIEADRWQWYVEQMVGVTSTLDTRMPSPFYLIWEFAIGGILLFAVVFGRWLDRWRLLVLLAGGVLVPSTLQIAYANTTGFVTQGRYMMPMLAGVVLYAAYVTEERGLDPARCRAMTRLFVLLLPVHLIFLGYTMVRWQAGLPPRTKITSLNPLVGEWHPVLGSPTALAASAVGIAVIGWLGWRAQSGPLGAPTAEADEASVIGGCPVAVAGPALSDATDRPS